jgi:hypothetical protein
VIQTNNSLDASSSSVPRLISLTIASFYDITTNMANRSSRKSGEATSNALVPRNGIYIEAPPEDASGGLLKIMENTVEDLRALVTCRVCVRPMYEPYMISCGHTFCYSCLAQWFCRHKSNKTCPDCRAVVKQQPAPAYVVSYRLLNLPWPTVY